MAFQLCGFEEYVPRRTPFSGVACFATHYEMLCLFAVSGRNRFVNYRECQLLVLYMCLHFIDRVVFTDADNLESFCFVFFIKALNEGRVEFPVRAPGCP